MRTIVSWGTLALLIAVGSFGTVRAARAQQVDDEAPKQETPAADSRLQQLDDEFELFLLQGTQVGSLTAARGRNNYMLKRKLAWLDRDYRLSKEQKERLQFAAQGDIKRLEDCIDRERHKFVTAHQKGRVAAEKATPDIGALRSALKTGAFGEHSLLAKMEPRVLTPEQIQRHERRRQQAAHSRIKITPDNVGSLVRAVRVEKAVISIAWDTQADVVGCLGDKQPLEIWSGDDFRPLRTFGAGRRLVGFDLCSRNDLVALGENSTQALLVSRSSGKEIVLDTNHQRPTVRFSPDGKFLATSGDASRALLWSTQSGQRIRDFDAGPAQGELTLAFSPNGRILAIGNLAALTKLFDVATGKLLVALPFPSPRELKFDPSGKRLAVAFSTGHLAVWDVKTGEILRIVKTFADELCSVDWSPDGNIIASAGLDVPVTLWQAQSLAKIGEVESPEWASCVRFNPSGTRLIFAGGSTGRKLSVEVFAVPQE
jgi:Anaphase-promoting complex subunit 4 WD40 domain